MKKLKIVLGVVGALAVLVTAIGFLLPSQLRVVRSVTVNAQPSAIFPLLSNFKTGWSQWNPFLDPKMTLSYAGADEGVGAVMSWQSPDGDGRLTITKADPARGIEYDMVTMQESFRLQGSLLCEPAGNATKLTWVDDMNLGNNPYRRYMGLFLDGALGDAFEKGLSTIKQKAEAPAGAGEKLVRP